MGTGLPGAGPVAADGEGAWQPTWQACRGKELSAEEISGALGVTWKEGKCRVRLAWLKAPLVEKH